MPEHTTPDRAAPEPAPTIRVRQDVDALDFRQFAFTSANITYAHSGQQLIAQAIANLARYCPQSGRVTLALTWVPDLGSPYEDDVLMDPGLGLPEGPAPL